MSAVLWFLAGGIVVGTPTGLALFVLLSGRVATRAVRASRAQMLIEYGWHQPVFEGCNPAVPERRRSPDEQFVTRAAPVVPRATDHISL